MLRLCVRISRVTEPVPSYDLLWLFEIEPIYRYADDGTGIHATSLPRLPQVVATRCLHRHRNAGRQALPALP